MNRVLSGEEDGWVKISEDDVVVRSLVRAQVASMHPDGSRIRLIDFHKEIEDEDGQMED
jgi:hypothetical protein